MKVYTVYRHFTTQTGSVFQVPAGTFSNEDAARKAAAEGQQTLQRLLGAELFYVHKDGAEQLQKTAGSLLAEMGISKFSHIISWTDVRESNLVVPEGPRLVLPGTGH